MQEAQTLKDGPTTGRWTTHCPYCESPVVVEGTEATRCPSCRRTVKPAGIRTAAMRLTERPPSDPQDSLVGTTLGRWRLVRLIGKGGMGRVYEAEDTAGSRFVKRRRVALKVLDEQLAADPAFVKRFRREARVLSGLSHPHVVQVLEQGEDDGRVWFAMAYVRGENLRTKIERGPLEPAEAVRIATEVGSALAYAHDRGIIHRDLKPENVLMDESGHVHLVDFGLSRLVSTGTAEASTRLTRTDVIMGTYEYMSPEQRRGDRALDARADIFGLGVMLYEMLTGTLPLGRFALPSERNPAIPQGLDAVVNKALATDRRDRYASAADFQSALAAGLASAPRSTTPPVTPGDPLADARRIMRHVDIMSAIDKVAGALLLAGGLGWISLSKIFAIGPVSPVVHVGGVFAMIFGIWLMDQGGKLAKLKKGSRESQITASAIMLLFPPFLTAAGIYGLVIMTSDRARHAFEVGRKRLRPDSSETVVMPQPAVTQTHAPKNVSILMRVFHFAAVLWSMYTIFVAIELFMLEPGRSNLLGIMEHGQAVRDISMFASAFALLVLLQSFVNRKTRRGVGLAVIAFVFLMTATALVLAGVEDAGVHLPAGLRHHLGPLWSSELLPRALDSALPLT